MGAVLSWFLLAAAWLAEALAQDWAVRRLKAWTKRIARGPEPVRLRLRAPGAEPTVEGDSRVVALTQEARTALRALQSISSGIAYARGPAADYEGEIPEGSFTLSRRAFLELEAKGLVIFHHEGRKLDLTHFGWILNPDTGRVHKIG